MGSNVNLSPDHSQIAQLNMASLESLSSAITAKSAQISKLLAAKSLPAPTFGEQSYADFANEDSELRKARNDLVDAAKDILRLAQGPEDHILQLAWSVSISPFSKPFSPVRIMTLFTKLTLHFRVRIQPI